MKMPRRRRKLCKVVLTILAAFAIMMSLTGCTSLSSLIKANISGVPYWVYSPKVGLGKDRVSFVGEGRASSSRQAELLAYSSIVDQLSEYLGVPLDQEVYRELSVLGTIQAYDLYVEDSFSRVLDRETAFYVYAVADSSLLEAASSEETIRRNEVSKNVEELVLQGDSYMKDEMFTRGISCYMQAMAASYGQDYIKEEYSYDTLFGDVMDIIGSITVSISSSDPSRARCTVAVTRKSVLLPSKVRNAEVLAMYRAVDMKGDAYDDSFVYITGADGGFVFDCLNFSMVRKGSVEFVLDFESELEVLERTTDPAIAATLRAAVEEESVRFDYDRAYILGDIAVAAIEFDSKGYAIGNKDTTDYLCSLLKTDGAEVSPFYAGSNLEEDVLYDYSQLKGGADCLLVCRFGQMDVVESRLGGFAASVEGTATLFDMKSLSTIYSSSVVYASAFGDTSQSAVKASFEKLADVVYSLLKADYV